MAKFLCIIKGFGTVCWRSLNVTDRCVCTGEAILEPVRTSRTAEMLRLKETIKPDGSVR